MKRYEQAVASRRDSEDVFWYETPPELESESESEDEEFRPDH
jgi:hypothetical protein